MTDIILSLGFLLLVCNMRHFSTIQGSQSLDENGNIKKKIGKYDT